MSTGRNNPNGSYYDFSDWIFANGTGGDAWEWWQKHDEFSNAEEWTRDLDSEEVNAIEWWTSAGYEDASVLYDTPWDDIPSYTKDALSDLYNAINKFELKKPAMFHRSTDFQIFGQPRGITGHMTVDQVKDYLKNRTDGGLIQVDGFMSFSTRKGGVSVAGSGLVIDLKVPKNKGMGAYVSGVGGNYGEREYLTNNNAILKFDEKSVKLDSKTGKIHVTARLMGRAQMQTIDPKNDSKYRKRGK